MNMSVPATFDYKNLYTSYYNPSTMHAADVGLTQFFQRYLLQRAMSVFKWEIPEHWEKSYMQYCLYVFGFFAVVKTNKFGVIPQGCSVKGYNVMYAPTNAVISNPLLRGIMEPRIGVECEIIRLQPDWCGIMDLVSFYAEMMSMTAATAGSNIMASKLAYMFAAKNSSFKESYKAMMDKILSGEPAVVVDKNMLNDEGKVNVQMFSNSLKSNYIADQLLTDLENWERRFDTEIGIPRTNTDKKERLVAGEVNASLSQSYTRVDMWLETIREGCEGANKMFGLNVRVDWRINPHAEGSLTNVQVGNTKPYNTA